MQQTLSQQLMAMEDGILSPVDPGISQRIPGVDIIPDDNPAAACRYEAIAALAYQLWKARGCPIGPPEADWSRAESLLRSKGEWQDHPPGSD